MPGIDNHTYGFNRDDHDALISKIEMGEVETPYPQAGDRVGIIIMTPSGGIPARVGTTVGKADCEVYRITDGDELQPTGDIYSIVNMTATPVEGDAYGQAKRISGRWVIDVEECEVDEPSSSSSSSVVP
jgi:hypothetical protein